MTNSKCLANSFSTGGGGFHFEAHVQASFVTLMLTGGYAPCLRCWRIVEIKLQGKIDGFDTDDLIVFVEDPNTKERRKLLGQVKHSITVTKGNSLFGEVIQAAWNDFNNPKIFTKGKDAIVLITGPLNATDARTVPWLLNQAKHTKNVQEFFKHVRQAKFSPRGATEKVDVIRHHLNNANADNEISDSDFYDFLNHFHLLSYDLGGESGVVLSLLFSHISQFEQQDPRWLWSRIVDIVQTWNQNAGTITPDKLPEDLLEAFKPKPLERIPAEFTAAQEKPETDWAQHPDATYLALATLIGRWNEKNQRDIEVVSSLLGISYEEWLKKARELLHHPDRPLSLKNGIWKVRNRTGLWNLLGSRVLDHDLETFKSLAISVLEERDPAFELPAEERYAAAIHGKVLEHSRELRQGISEGLAILGSLPDSCSNCSQGKAEATCVFVLREILTDADWVLWGSLNDLLPTLAEAAPAEFLYLVEKALRKAPCPFDRLFAEEGKGIFSSNYLSGLLWALEGLAWDEQYLVRVSVVLGELASRDPGGQWANRPLNSLVTILLPWLPQTLASIDKRKVAVQTLLNEWPDVAWNLLIQLLPNQDQTSTGSHKPMWRKSIPDDWENSVTREEYWQQVSFYAELSVRAAGYNTVRLTELIDHFDKLPKPAFDQLVEVLSSQAITELPDDQRLLLWDRLSRFTNEHRRFSDAEWALPDELITRIEKVAQQLAPADPFNLYMHLFTGREIDFCEYKGNWEEQRKKLEERREKAIREILQLKGVDGVIRFAESVDYPEKVGYAIDAIDDETIERAFLPHFLNTEDKKHKALVSGYIWRRYQVKGWDWCDNIDKSDWTPAQIGQFLACLPFTKEAWDRASDWLQDHEGEYWTRTSANPYQADGDLHIAIEKLIEYGRPHVAIDCLNKMLNDQHLIDTNQCIRALLAALSSSEPTSVKDSDNIVELIKYLQTDPSVDQEDLFRVEWAYLPLLNRQRGAAPKLLETKLANDPEFFCEVIRLIYRSKNDDQPTKEPSEKEKAIATNAWRLLNEWKTPPGIQEDGTFDENHFREWLQKVKKACLESGHLEVALIHIGQVLIFSPSDPDGLWIHRSVAQALNDRDADKMRSGFRTATYNARGAHWVDPTGKTEKELAEQFRRKAEDMENAGFHRFAETLRELEKFYYGEAQRIIDENKNMDE